jgi:predicted metal-dependent hydrolase
MTDLQVYHDGYPAYRRKVRFDWSNTPLHWVPDDPFATHTMNVLHLLLPEGERHFVKAVDEAAPLVDDPKLKAAIKPFVQQESWHAWAHQVVLDHLAEQGIDTTPYTDRLGGWLSALGDQREGWPAWLQRWWLYRRLADVAALEHFTAVLGQW